MISDQELQSIAKMMDDITRGDKMEPQDIRIQSYTGAHSEHNPEPIFVLYAADPSAASFVDQWADFNSYKLGQSHPSIVGARAVAQAMRNWKK